MERKWQDAIITDCELILKRPLRDPEITFIRSRIAYIALEMIHDNVKSLADNPKELERYLASETGPAAQASRFVAAAENNRVADLEQLLAAGADIGAHEPLFNRTALHAASDQCHRKVVAFLIEHKAPLDALDGNSMTALMCACSKGKKKGSEVALLLIKAGADVQYVRKEDGMNAIKFALWGQCSKGVLEALVAKGAERPGPDFKVVHPV